MKFSRPRCSPHYSKSTDEEKVAWEYKSATPFFDLKILDGKDVLDVGCAWGGKVIYYAEKSKLKTIHAFDLPEIHTSTAAKAYADMKGTKNCFFNDGYAEDMPYNDDSFDVVIMDDVLEHVSDPEKVISECYRVLRHGGVALVKFPSFKSMYAHHLDRATTLPALHYVLHIKKWAAGLNYLLFNSGGKYNFYPFRRTVATRYHRSITGDLNGLYFKAFKKNVHNSEFQVEQLKLVHYNPVNKWKRFFYKLACGFPLTREFLSTHIFFIGSKK